MSLGWSVRDVYPNIVSTWRDCQDLERYKPGLTGRLVDWLKMYKTSDGKPPNDLAQVGGAASLTPFYLSYRLY